MNLGYIMYSQNYDNFRFDEFKTSVLSKIEFEKGDNITKAFIRNKIKSAYSSEIWIYDSLLINEKISSYEIVTIHHNHSLIFKSYVVYHTVKDEYFVRVIDHYQQSQSKSETIKKIHFNFFIDVAENIQIRSPSGVGNDFIITGIVGESGYIYSYVAANSNNIEISQILILEKILNLAY